MNTSSGPPCLEHERAAVGLPPALEEATPGKTALRLLAAFVVAWIAGCTTRPTTPREMSTLTTLTVAEAERLVFQDPSEPPRQIRLELDGLTTLPQDVAEVFARPTRHTYWISLDGVAALSPQAAEALVRNANHLSLGGLGTISPELAEVFGKYRGDLILNGIASMTPGVAAAVARGKGFLCLNGLTTLSPETARALAGNSTQQLALNGVSEISHEVARGLAATRSDLYVNGLKNMTPEVADALVSYDGNGLWLTGLDKRVVAPEIVATLRRNPAIKLIADRRDLEDMDRYELLLDNHSRIRRTVSRRPDGVETVTESDSEEIAALIREHASAMQGRLAEPRAIGTHVPLVLEIFRHADRISMKLTDTEKGARALVTSDDPYVVTLIQAHADRVSGVVEFGRNAGSVPVPARPE